MENDIYIVNPEYRLKPDKNRVLIMNRRVNSLDVDDFIGFVHPVYAILLSQFDGKKPLGEVINQTAAKLNKDRAAALNIITPLLENNETMHFHYDGHHFSFPRDLLVKKTDGMLLEKYNPQEFMIPKKELDMDAWRLHVPLDALFMINTLCATDCVYCYADRRKRMDCSIPLERLKELIREAKKLDMRSFDLTGGELFLYKYWQEFLAELLANDFVPYISTKIPIDDDIIMKLKDLGLKRIQISIDSIIKDELITMLNVGEDYYHKLKETFERLDENGFEIYTNTQVTSVNQHNISQLLDYILSLKNIRRVNFGVAGFSLYKTEENYRKYRADLDNIKKIETTLNELKPKYKNKVNISFSGYASRNDLFPEKPEDKAKRFMERARCSGNFYAFIILPDGKATICEELYWHPKFIFGDLMTQSIEEVWNSKRALELYHISKDMVSEESECKKCEEFEPCHKYKGVCWKEALMAYGYENWDYPDPKCPRAPLPKREYYID